MDGGYFTRVFWNGTFQKWVSKGRNSPDDLSMLHLTIAFCTEDWMLDWT